MEKNLRRFSKETRQKQKENLKILVENSSVSRIHNAGRVMKYGIASFSRNIWLSLAAILVMTVTLVILLVTTGASLILSSTAASMREKIDITIYFKPGTDYDVLTNMGEILKSDPNVRDVEISDSAMEYAIFLKENRENEDIMAALDDDLMTEVMLSRIQALMRVKVYDPENLNSIKNLVNTTAIFQENLDDKREPTYDTNSEQIAKITSWANIAKNGGLILGAVFLVISILMIFNTVRMAIFSRREEIHMMKLVGADTSFIRGPFVVEAQICGIISGLLASTLAYLGYTLAAPSMLNYGISMETVTEYMSTSKLVLVYLAVIGLGMLIGYISARLAMKKYLK